jgi:hypothetical protein
MMSNEAWEKFIQTAHDAGMRRDQLENFVKAGYIPQPQQIYFHVACREADKDDGPTKIAAEGDRGGAKSHAIVAQMGLDDCQRVEGLYCLYLRRYGKAAKEQLERLREKIFKNVPNKFNGQRGIIIFPNGSTIIIGHFKDDGDIDQYLGIEYDDIVIEETTQLSEKKVELVLGSLRTSRPNWRARAYFGTNPGGMGHAWFKTMFIMPRRDNNETDTRAIQMSWRENVFIAPEYIAYLGSLTGVLAKMWRDGDWDVAAGQFFANFNHETHVIAPFAIPSSWPIWASLDYGYSHPTAVYWHTVDGDGNYYTIAEHVEARQLPPYHAKRIEEVCQQLGLEGSWLENFYAGHDCFAVKGDRKGKTIADQYEAEGIVLEMANTDRVGGAAILLGLLGDEENTAKWFIFNTCPRLIECLPSLLVDPKRPEDVLKIDADERGKGGDDAYDAARYGLASRGELRKGLIAQGITRRGA